MQKNLRTNKSCKVKQLSKQHFLVFSDKKLEFQGVRKKYQRYIKFRHLIAT